MLINVSSRRSSRCDMKVSMERQSMARCCVLDDRGAVAQKQRIRLLKERALGDSDLGSGASASLELETSMTSVAGAASSY